ncbi:MAG: pyruvate kinase [Clostridiales bacterium]|nr:MAG: pyruvate kinase [Clostridiales bacterium]
MRKTKIVCTLGPASTNEETITQMCLAGMNVARLNFSHGSYEEHQLQFDLIKKVREKLGMPVAILLDTKGPEYRIKTFQNGRIHLEDGAQFTFTAEEVIGDESRVSVSYKNLVQELEPGDRILVNDGMVAFRVEKIQGQDIICTTETGGDLSDRKSMSFPNKTLKQPYLSEQDKEDILFGIRNGVDFIACSFVSCRQDLLDVRKFIRANGNGSTDLIAKIENQAGVDHIEEICRESDGIMVARGDMGVEIPFEELPAIQKRIITVCRKLGKRTITATEMLESMIHNPRPTRAEISDVANAVYDGTSAIMLSGETAAGKYPVRTVQTMARIAEKTEQNISYAKRFHNNEFIIKNPVDAISHATCGMAMDLDAKAIVVCSLSGITARMVSRYRCPIDIIGLTANERTFRKLALSWGVTPVLGKMVTNLGDLFEEAKKEACNEFGLREGDTIVVTGGVINGESGNTNLIKVETIEQ